MALQFDKYAQEGNTFLKELAEELDHPEEISRTGILVRSVLHTLRDRIGMGESLNFMAQLPMFLKAVYASEWKYHEKPERLKNMEEFKDKVKERQSQSGEIDFDWDQSTEQLIEKILGFINKKYVSPGEIEDVKDNLPEDLKRIFGPV
ncbi:MAG: DUF2267 domain-containing protein [Gammaproteobacteria bacterium]|nr:DUF2267 domain-containing protein [Gammaproteobacteria bacterium]